MVSGRSRSFRYLLIGAVVCVLAVAAAVGGWWFFIREDAQLATEAPAIPQELLQATAADASSDGSAPVDEGAPVAADTLSYRIIPEQSEAAYFADEKLASLPLPSTAKGSTSEIEGEFYLTADGTALAPDPTSAFTVDLRNLKSDQSRRDSRVQDALETGIFPTATFTVSDVSGYDPSIPEGQEQSLQMTGTLDLHGVQREVVWDVKARREATVIAALATVNFRYGDFDITAPNIAGFVSVEDDVTLQVQIVAVEV